jgi:hypothetical protein
MDGQGREIQTLTVLFIDAIRDSEGSPILLSCSVYRWSFLGQGFDVISLGQKEQGAANSNRKRSKRLQLLRDADLSP